MGLTDVKKFIDGHEYIVKKSSMSRFMDQKCTPDVVCAVCECVLEFVKDDIKKEFSKSDIWHSNHAENLITSVFSKPDLSEKAAKNEYDKFFSQPLQMLAFAGVLSRRSENGVIFYQIKEKGLINFISQNEISAFHFLHLYLIKVMKDCSVFSLFESFFEKQNSRSFTNLRAGLNQFIHALMNIENKYEPSRIYNKIINIIAFGKGKKGTHNGQISLEPITINDIRYNQKNWRDLRKPKGITRNEFISQIIKDTNASARLDWYAKKAADSVKKLHKYSEIHPIEKDDYMTMHAHHIFPRSIFPELASYIENIICVTANQHISKCHPMNTQLIDKEYRVVCLLAKLDSIEKDYENTIKHYSLSKFADILNKGFNVNIFSGNMSFEEFKYKLVKCACEGK